MHTFVEEEGFKEVLRLDLYNKFKLNNNDLDLFYNFDRQLYIHEFLFLENINSFEDFSSIYEEKFSNVQLNFQNFENFFFNAVFDMNTFKSDFYFSDIIKKFNSNQIFLLYQEALFLYDQLAFLYSYDVFFLGLFDICQTMHVKNLVFFFDNLGQFIFFLENFLFNLKIFFSLENFFLLPEFSNFLDESLLFFSKNFLNIFDNFNSLKIFIDYLCFFHFFGFLDNSFFYNDFFFSKSYDNF